MTDETRPTEGRTTSDYPEPQGRPDFLPADDSPEVPSPRQEPPASFGTSWGDPSGRPTSGVPPYGGSPPSGASYGGPSFTTPPFSASNSYESPSYGNSYETSSYGSSHGSPPFGGGPDNGTRAYEAPLFGGPPPSGPPGPPGPSGGGTPLPPPRQALPMGTGWAPPPPGAQGVPGPRRMPSTAFLVSTAVAIALVASLFGSVGTYLLTRPSGGSDPSYSLGPLPTGATNREPGSVAGVAARVLPSVVSIEAGTTTEGATGSGFLIKNGYVVTNNHVVALAAKGGEIRIMFNNRKTTSGRIVGRDPGSDLAVVKPEDTFGTPEITLGNSDQVVVGDPVIAIGSPLGLTGTVTTGIVSSLNRPVIAGDETGTSTEEPAYISAIQTDAAINPGNSGGPLVNGKGEVVGVNSAIATLGRSESSQSGSIGLGFAIPVNQTRRVAEELITTGKAKRPKIGIVLDKDYKGQGVKIASGPSGGRQPVDANGPADKAGLKAGDVILEIDGLTLQDGNELIALIRSKAPGSKVTIKYQRAGKDHTATLTVVAEDEPTPTPS
ncbi:trypsin-like peptidase domain-containing protein [Nonomuraea sp. CA-141351]|uniref:S1C family serine protease n=1 Tax=Nonomuraea sp. CA-141351 TaxID=3239996 RepID=UPI003D92E770